MNRVEVVTLITSLALFVACGPRLRLDPAGQTIQRQCGVNGHDEVTEQQATCIARLAGLETGIRFWRVTRWRNGEDGIPSWHVCNTMTPPHDGSGSSGRCIGVRVSDGGIVLAAPWESGGPIH